MSTEVNKADPARVVFATMPGFELVRYAGHGGWHLWSRTSGKEAKDAQVIYGRDGGSRFYAAVHRLALGCPVFLGRGEWPMLATVSKLV